MELTYQSPMMPAAYTAISAEEMTYIDGGTITIGSVSITFHPEVLATYCVNFVANFANMMGKAAFAGAVGGLVLMHKDGMTIPQSISYYWEGQTTAGKVGTVVVGGLAGLYVYQKVLSIYNTVKSIYIDLKNAYEQTMAQQSQTAATQDAGLPDPILAAAA